MELDRLGLSFVSRVSYFFLLKFCFCICKIKCLMFKVVGSIKGEDRFRAMFGLEDVL